MSKNTNLSFLTDYITADITNGRIGINNASPTVAFDVVGATKITGALTLTSTISNGTYTYTLPSATGTLALTSAISGTTNYVAKFTSSSAIGNSQIFDNGTNVGINTASPGAKLHVVGSFAEQIRFGTNTTVYTNISMGTGFTVFDSIGGDSGAFDLRDDGTSRLFIATAGNVGIGTSSPSNKLEVIGASGVDNFIFSSGGAGTTLGGFKFGNGTGVYGSLYFDNATNNVILFQQYVSGNLIFGTNTTERMRITSGGNVQIGGTTAGNFALYVKGVSNTNANFALVVNNSTPSDLFFVRNDGLINTGQQSASPYNNADTGRTMIVNSGGTLGYTSSTRESKTNIKQLSDVSWLYQLNPVSFNYRKKDNEMNYMEEFYDEKWYGLIADEVESINKDLVFYNTKENDSKKLAGVEYNKLISALVKAAQEQQVQIEELKTLLKAK